jgi:hypothetical protein
MSTKVKIVTIKEAIDGFFYPVKLREGQSLRLCPSENFCYLDFVFG